MVDLLYFSVLNLNQNAKDAANELNFELKAYNFNADSEDVRSPRRVRVGLIQNTIVLPTTDPVPAQRDALLNKIGQIIGVAHECGVNIICMQEAWSKNHIYSTYTISRAIISDHLFDI